MMNFIYTYIYLSVFCAFYINSVSGFQDDSFLDGQLTVIIEDTLEADDQNSSFSPRSSVHIRSVKSGTAVVTHTRELTEIHSEHLKTLAETGGLYRIRVQQKGAEDRGYIYSFTKACLLYESSLSEIITIMLDNNGASLVGVGLFTPVTVCQGVRDVPLIKSFNTTVVTRSPIQAPVPDTATYIQKIEAMKTGKTGDGKDNRSFFAKYWMYIVPVVLILLISGGTQEGGR